MKLNAATELIPITWAAFAELHPFCPPDQALRNEPCFQNWKRTLQKLQALQGVFAAEQRRARRIHGPHGHSGFPRVPWRVAS